MHVGSTSTLHLSPLLLLPRLRFPREYIDIIDDSCLKYG